MNGLTSTILEAPSPEESSLGIDLGLQAEVDRVLHHPLFAHTERCSKLLRYLAAASAVRDGAQPKERLIGHEVFGRDPGYDTNTDPVVRNAASDVRKRLKQYYRESTSWPFQLELAPGSYRLVLRSTSEGLPVALPLPGPQNALVSDVNPSAIALRQSTETDHNPSIALNRRNLLFGLGASLLVPAIFSGGYAVGRKRGVHEQPAQMSPDPFWGPLLGGGRFLISVGTDRGAESGISSAKGDTTLISEENAKAFALVQEWLNHYAAPVTVRTDSRTKMADLLEGKSVIVGQFSNLWINKLGAELPVLCKEDPRNGSCWFEDKTNPSKKWETSKAGTGDQKFSDYGMIARFRSRVTSMRTVIVTGLAPQSVYAAAYFMTLPRALATLNRAIAQAEGNVQYLFRTSIVDGVTGIASIVAEYRW